MSEGVLSWANGGILSLVTESGLVVKGVLILLLIFSVACWAIILYKYRVIRSARVQTNKFLKVFWMNHPLTTLIQTAKQYPASPVSRLFEAAYQELSKIFQRESGTKTAQDQGNRVEVIGGSEIIGIENVKRAL
ncbi:MAG: flagellar motor protein MotA, partial [bacterium]|nr:flagellar motor protein MotA [bacterium]